MTKLPQNFMWGGALAANQFEGGYEKGGKGLSVIDVMTSGAHGKARRITESIDLNRYYPNHEGIDFFIIVIRKILPCLKKMGLKCLRTSIRGRVFFRMGMKMCQIKRLLPFMIVSLMN